MAGIGMSIACRARCLSRLADGRIFAQAFFYWGVTVKIFEGAGRGFNFREGFGGLFEREFVI